MLLYIASSMVNQQEQEELLTNFKAMDKDGNGTISRDELLQAYIKMYPNELEIEKEVDKIIQSVDINQSGLIDFTEFVAASIQKEKILSKQKVQQAFDVFDIDKNGVISKDELEQIMGGLTISEENWKLLMEQIDSNGDGFIQFAEFINLLDSEKLFQ